MKNKVLTKHSLFFSVLSLIMFFTLCSKITAVHAEESEFEKVAKKIETMIAEAVSQYKKEDYTALKNPVKYKILWLGFTKVTYDDLDFRMTDSDIEYLKAVTLNFEKTVERITNNNLDISIDLHFISDEKTLTKNSNADWLFLAQETVQPDIDRFDKGQYDSVITTVQTDGYENSKRNKGKSGYGKHYVMLGLKTAGIENGIGYSTFKLGMPKSGTYPLDRPEIPSLYATAVAVHEWLHQIEYLGKYLKIDYPPTHAYGGEPKYPGYKKYIADQNNYDFFEFYELVLSGKVPYNGMDKVKLVGMYPYMWPLTKRGVALNKVGLYKITNLNDEFLYTNETDKTLTVSQNELLWKIYYGGANRFILIPDKYPKLRIDLFNAWDKEKNKVSMHTYTGYDDAQSWKLTQNSDGTYCIRTPYKSGRAITIDEEGSNAYISTTKGEPSDSQKWIITKIE